MKVDLVRIYNCPTYSIGRIYVDGEYMTDCIEDTDRGLDQSWPLADIKRKKVYKMTAIPTGVYDMTMDIQSPKFSQYEYYRKLCKGYLPRIVGIKGFEGVLFHCGSSAQSSAGCVIVGYNTVKGRVTDSRRAFEKLMKEFNAAKVMGEDITLTITRKYKVG